MADFLDFNCIDCHDDDFQKGGLRLDTLSTTLSDEEAFKTWVKVFDKVSAGEMPQKRRRSLTRRIKLPF